MTNAPLTKIGHDRDVDSLNHDTLDAGAGIPEQTISRSVAAKSRDHARTPMQWDDTDHAGFTTGNPWFDVNPNHATINAAAAQHDLGSVYHHIKALIRLRHEHSVVREGRFHLLLPYHPQIWAFTRTLGNHQLLVLANCSSQHAAISTDELPRLTGARLLLGTHGTGARTHLDPWESRILRLWKGPGA